MSFGFKIKLTILLAAVGMMTASVFCYAEDFGLGEAGSVSGLTANKITAMGSIPSVLGDLVGVTLSLLGIFFFILVLYAGFIWMTAAGSGEQVDKAKKILMSGAIGLVIVLSAYTITSYVFTQFLAGAPTGKSGDSACATAVDGKDCGDNSVCQNKKCIDECKYTYGKTAKCQPPKSCSGGIEDPGFCPGTGPTSPVCCVPQAAYDAVHKVDTETVAPEAEATAPTSCSNASGVCITSGDASCDASVGYREVAGTFTDCSKKQVCCIDSCKEKGGQCWMTNDCSAFRGKEEAVACGAGRVCCVTCDSQGGTCYSSSNHSCLGGKSISGAKSGCPEELNCCLGGTLQLHF